MEKLLCRPCAEQLVSAGKAKILYSIKEKDTCYSCERRRYLYIVDVKKGTRIKKRAK